MKQRTVNIIKGLIDLVERNTCTHEETYRGGAIWTICSDCGEKWADDEGGFIPYKQPEALKAAYKLLDEKCKGA